MNTPTQYTFILRIQGCEFDETVKDYVSFDRAVAGSGNRAHCDAFLAVVPACYKADAAKYVAPLLVGGVPVSIGAVADMDGTRLRFEKVEVVL